MSGMESQGAEDKHKQADRALRPPACLPGTVFTEPHTRDGAGAERREPLLYFPEGREEAACHHPFAALVQGECRYQGDPTPRAQRQRKGSQGTEATLLLPVGSLGDSCSQMNLEPHLLPQHALMARPLPLPDAKSLSADL